MKHRRRLWRSPSLNVCEAILSKAEWLIENRRVKRVAEDKWLVAGIKNRHIVRRGATGFLYCNCKGFQACGTCSHVVAVFIKENGRVKAEAEA